jgi:hypothetical protein
MTLVTPEEAVSRIRSGDHIYIHTAAAAPQQMIHALTAPHAELKKIQIFHLHTEGDAPYAIPEYLDSFNTHAFFTGKNVRPAMKRGEADYIPVFLSEVPHLFNRRIVNLNAALIHVSPPDKHGYCSLGVSIDATRAAILNAAGWHASGESVFLARERHLRALEKARSHLDAARKELARWEFFAEELRLAHGALGLITGEFTADDLLGEIFSRFCVGK